MIDVTKRGATTVIGGGDTGAAAREVIIDGVTVADQITHCSTGGGSSLVLMEGKSLPAVDHLSDVVDLPPGGVDFNMVWGELQKVRRENKSLKNKMEGLDAQVKAPKAQPELWTYGLLGLSICSFGLHLLQRLK